MKEDLKNQKIEEIPLQDISEELGKFMMSHHKIYPP